MLYGEAVWVPSGLTDSLLAENPVAELLKCEKSFKTTSMNQMYGFDKVIYPKYSKHCTLPRPSEISEKNWST
jgi:hypothetical protein